MTAALDGDDPLAGGAWAEDETAALVAELELRVRSLVEAIATLGAATEPGAPTVTTSDEARVAHRLEVVSRRVEHARARAKNQKRAMKQWWAWWEQLPLESRAAEATRIERESYARAAVIAGIEAEVRRLTESQASLQREATFVAAARAVAAGADRPDLGRLEKELAEARAALTVAEPATRHTPASTT